MVIVFCSVGKVCDGMQGHETSRGHSVISSLTAVHHYISRGCGLLPSLMGGKVINIRGSGIGKNLMQTKRFKISFYVGCLFSKCFYMQSEPGENSLFGFLDQWEMSPYPTCN